MAKAMKNSGIVWLGIIPDNWDLIKWRYILTERNEKNDDLETKEVLSLGYNYGLIPAAEKEYSGGNKAREDLTGYKKVRPNDIVMNSMNIVCGSVDISKYTGCVSPVYYAFYTNKNEPRYFNYLFKTEQFERSLLGLGNGILIKETESGKFVSVRLRIPIDKLKPLLLPLPPLVEQQKIATFLDKKCSEIDAVLTKTRESIEEYKLLKNAIITQAVTKGIRSNRKMKDSGIEWIGEIPEEWNTIKLKYVCEYNKESLGEDTPTDYLFDYIDIGSVVNGEGITNYERMKFEDSPSRARRIVSEKNIILSTVRTYLKAAAIIPKHDLPLIVSTGFIVLAAKKEINSNYLFYAILADYFIDLVEAKSVGISYPAINSSEIVNFKITFPALTEQQEIADYLEKKCSEIDSLILKKEQLITELETYKKSLIYEYVTGKKEVQ